MASPNFDRQIRQKIEAFVEELSVLVRQAAVQSVTEAFGASPAEAIRAGGRRGARAARPGGKGQKRTPEELQTLAEQLAAAIKSKPGLRMEQIADSLGTTTQDLALPAKKLMAEKRIKTKGERRATKYFPA